MEGVPRAHRDYEWRVFVQKQIIIRLTIGLAVYLFASFFCVRAHAQIAYSARYYYPPGLKKTSHYHIYFMQIPTGRVQQLTHGRWDDLDVCFSPDGKYLGFVRRSYFDADDEHFNGWLCLFSMAKDRIVNQVAFSGKSMLGDLQWDRDGRVLYQEGGPAVAVNGRRATVPQDADPSTSPDGLYKASDVSQHGNYGLQVVNVRTGKSVWKLFSTGCTSGMWEAPHTYIVLDTSSCGAPAPLLSYLSHSTAQRYIPARSQFTIRQAPVPSCRLSASSLV
jgi:hypothetical protein